MNSIRADHPSIFGHYAEVVREANRPVYCERNRVYDQIQEKRGELYVSQNAAAIFWALNEVEDEVIHDQQTG